MWSFIFEIAVFTGLAGVIVLALRALPRASNEIFVESRSRIRTHEFVLMIERADEVWNAWFEKFLRRLKVLILRFDNVVTKKIAKVTDDRVKEKTSFVISSGDTEEGDRMAITEEGKSPEEGRLVSIGAPMEIVEPPKKRGRKKVSL